LTELLLRIEALWRTDRDRINLVAAQVTAQLKAAADETATGVAINDTAHEQAVKQISEIYDDEFGGFGAAPKFPRPGIYLLLLEVAAARQAYSDQAFDMVRDTLIAMSQGGIYDHVGGGFHRYSVDAQWQVPHFEKMLYSQALLALAYTRLYETEPDQRYRDTVIATLDFVLREMQHPAGAFYSALDASSERMDKPGEYAEGAYYLWDATQLESLLSEEEENFFSAYFTIHDDGNIHSDPRGEFEQLNILHVSEEFRHSKLADDESAVVASALRKLYTARLKRPRPHLDDKIITAWNGMMISALVEAARVFADESYLDAATNAAGYLQLKLVDDSTSKLMRRVRAGEAGIDATLDDYVWYVNGLLALYRQTDDKQWLALALQLTDSQVQLFYDRDHGGFFESGADKNVLFRSRSAYDGALPAPNAIAVANLNILAELTGATKWRQMAAATLQSFAAAINADPGAAAWLLAQIKPAADDK
jgi:uncharacterized protein YyaL (SSP411 family)